MLAEGNMYGQPTEQAHTSSRLITSKRDRLAHVVARYASNEPQSHGFSPDQVLSDMRSSIGEDGAEAIDLFIAHAVTRQIKLIY